MAVKWVMKADGLLRNINVKIIWLLKFLTFCNFERVSCCVKMFACDHFFFCGQSTPLGCMCAMDLSHFLSSRRNAWREGNGAVSVTQHTQDSLSFAWTSHNNEIVLFCVILERFHQEPCRIKLAEQDHFNFQSSCTHLLNSSWLSCTVLIKSF